MMKKKLLLGIGFCLLVGATLGISLTIRNDWINPSKAVEYLHPVPEAASPVPAIQPTALAPTSLPNFVELAKKVKPSVVNVSSEKKVKRQGPVRRFGPQQDPFDDFFENFFHGPGMAPPVERPTQSLGSGFVINADGYILTNNHVIEGADEIHVQFVDKRKKEAKVIGSDPKTDIAVIKIEGGSGSYVDIGDSDRTEVGEWVMAVGNPFGLDSTVTVGVISAKGRVIGAGPYDDFLQTDASINPGNSGGPLFNAQGQVIGINTAIVASGQGLGFAIPINLAKDLVPQLISKGKVTRAWLGVGIQDITPELAKSFDLPDQKGALISSVFPDSPAAKAGFKNGDIVRKLNGEEIAESHNLPTLVARMPVGKKITVEFLREGKPMTLEVTLGEMEEGQKKAEAAMGQSSEELGLRVRDITPEEAQGHKLQGVLVEEVDPNSAAAQVGVQAGDVLLKVNNEVINSVSDFAGASDKIKKGSVVRLYIQRDDASIYLAFTK